MIKSVISRLLTLDIKDIPTFHLFENYDEGRDIKSLEGNEVIRSISPRDQRKVINSLLLPNPVILKLGQAIISNGNPTITNFIKLILYLFEKIKEILDLRDTIFIGVLRSGFLIAVLMRYIAIKYHNIEIPIVGITPNYLDRIQIEHLKKFFSSNDRKNVIFLDGWISTGTTYFIIKEFWEKLFPKHSFNFATISNISNLNQKEILYSTKEDILLPWSIALTDNIGLSNYFLHPQKNITTSFYIPKQNRKINNSEINYFKAIDKELNRKYKKFTHIHDSVSRKLTSPAEQDNIFGKSDIKLGINECIKSFEKGIASEIFVNPAINTIYLKILIKYSKIYRVKIKFLKNLFINGCHCAVSRNNFG